MRQEINVTYTQTVQTYTHAHTLRTLNAKAQNPSLKHYAEGTKSERFYRGQHITLISGVFPQATFKLSTWTSDHASI